jgi:hypothetical protein
MHRAFRMHAAPIPSRLECGCRDAHSQGFNLDVCVILPSCRVVADSLKTNTQNQVAAMSGLIASPTSPPSSKDAATIAMLLLQESEGHKNGEIAMGTVVESQVLDVENQIDVVYPSGVRLALIVSCLASSVFLVALVSDHHSTPPILLQISNFCPGRNHNCDCHPNNHESI